MRWIPGLLLLCAAAAAQDAARPRHNSSYVPADDQAVAGLVAEAVRAARAGDAPTAADRLQALLLSPRRGLVALREDLTYTSARRWAQIRLLSGREPFGPEVLKAWRDVHDRLANDLVRAAIQAGDEDALLALLDRHPACTAAPVALLALLDRALQRGDPDAAHGFLLRIPEHLARSEEKAFLESEPYRRRRAHLEALGPRRPSGWPTLGGDATRARNGDALPGGELVRLWETPVLDQVPGTLGDFLPPPHERERSVDLPFYPTFDADRAYVHLGYAVAALSRTTGKLLFFAPEGSFPQAHWIDDLVLKNPGVRAATVHDGVLYFDRVVYDDGRWLPKPTNTLVAFDVATRRTLWEIRRGGIGKAVFFRGAPAVAGERLYVYGAVRATGDDKEPTRKEEAFLFCFDRVSGDLLWHRLLGVGQTDAASRFPPLTGLAPAVSGGVVVAVSGLGIAAALDARTGEVLWLLRYDRRDVRYRERLAGDDDQEEKVHQPAGWKREPPRIAGDSVYFAPFDATELFCCWLRGRRGSDGSFHVEQWAKARDSGHGRHSLLESVAGLSGGRIYYVGRRDPRPAFAASFKTLVAHPLDRTVGWSSGLVPATERDLENGARVPPEVFGRPAIAGKVVLVPTRHAVYRFDAGLDPVVSTEKGETRREIAPLEPYLAPPRPEEKEGERAPAFGTLVAIDGLLYAVTADRVICYGVKSP